LGFSMKGLGFWALNLRSVVQGLGFAIEGLGLGLANAVFEFRVCDQRF
jgi:hypothetical protein